MNLLKYTGDKHLLVVLLKHPDKIGKSKTIFLIFKSFYFIGNVLFQVYSNCLFLVSKLSIFNCSSNKFQVQLSRDASSQLKRFLHEQKSSPIIINIIKNHIQIDVCDGAGRTQAQVRATLGGLLGEASRSGKCSLIKFNNIVK